MNANQERTINSMPEFLAHALQLELESAERYRELADSMEVHNNPEVAGLFRTMAEYGDLHAAEVRTLAESYELPEISPWDFKWTTPESPEAPALEDANYLMNKCQALELALHNEIKGRDFYACVAREAGGEDVRGVAAQMATEEDGHVDMLRAWMVREACNATPPIPDLDPPNITG
ncbi:MAG: ferritin family protein [Gammaproteobacteria bacterium]|jgi:rubrerythrin